MILDGFNLLVRGCKRLEPDGYLVTLEIRRRKTEPDVRPSKEESRTSGHENVAQEVPSK